MYANDMTNTSSGRIIRGGSDVARACNGSTGPGAL